MTTAATIERAILRDREQRPARTIPEANASCFHCGKPFAYRGPRGDNSGRFCSHQCRIEYDIPGAFSFDPFKVTRRRVIAGSDPGYLVATPMTPVKHKDQPGGWRVACRGCGKPFESRGWVYCSRDCKRLSAERTANRAAILEADMELPAKRPCPAPGCRHAIPVWREGRRVSSRTRFCSDLCRSRASRSNKMLVEGDCRPTGVLSRKTSKKCLQNGPSEEAA
jgi:hypothetical protein